MTQTSDNFKLWLFMSETVVGLISAFTPVEC